MSDNRLSDNHPVVLGTASRRTALWARLGGLGARAQAGVVVGVVAVLWVASAPLALAISGTAGLAAAAVGAGVCLLGAESALAVGWLFRGPAAAMYAMLLGMTVRMMVPLFLGVALHLLVPALAEAAMIFYLLVFYLATLAVETVLLVAQIRPSSTQA